MGIPAGKSGERRPRPGAGCGPGTARHDRVVTAAGSLRQTDRGGPFHKTVSRVLKIKIPISSPPPDGSKGAAAAKVGGKRKAKVKDKVKGQEKVKAKEEAKVKMKEKVKG